MPRAFAPSTEFRLVCAACRWPQDAARDAEICSLAENADWDRVAQIARRHRVEGLVAHALAQSGAVLPESHTRAFASAAANARTAGLKLTVETVKLHRLLESAGIPALFVKGVVLGQLAYGTIAHKRSLDVDVLVAPADLAAVSTLLRREGFVTIIPEGEWSDAQLAAWARVSNETCWLHAGRKLLIDVHGALLDNPRLLPGVGMGSPTQTVTVGGVAIPTLASDDLYAYLCAHGAMHGWARLKWIADLAALLRDLPPAELERLHDHAAELGIERCSAQALLLANELLALPLPTALDARLRRSRANRALLDVAMASVAGKFEAQVARIGTLDTVPVLLSHFRLRRDWRYRRHEFARKLTNPVDRMKGVLPESLGFLYPLLSITRWSGRQIRGLMPGQRAQG